MAKQKKQYFCQQCSANHSQWNGQCNTCGAWNSLTEIAAAPSRKVGYAGVESAQVTKLKEVSFEQTDRMPTGLAELDRVLGGGLVYGSIVLIGGDPGIGKSTLLLQSLTALSNQVKALYVTGEESLAQISMRAKRLGLQADHLDCLAETQVEKIIQAAQELKPKVMVIDSIQTIFTESLNSAPGGVSQVRESAATLVQYAKQTNTAILLVGHVTKEGALAGPRVLEHMVDAVLYFEGETDGRYRMIRAIKNRFGAVGELGIFAMLESGLKEVSNPSAIFLSKNIKPTPGSVILCTFEGTRPMLVEVQALVTTTQNPNPRRVCVGLDQNRLSMLLAVLHRHGGIVTADQDVFVNVVGGVKVSETAIDLAILLACVSSLKNQILPRDLMVFGEVGLSGEIRPVQSGQERLKEAAKHGFSAAIIPKQNAPKENNQPLKTITVEDLCQALQAIQ